MGMDDDDCSSLHWILNDPRRIETLESTALLDSPPEKIFDRMTSMASRMLNVPVTLVSLVDRERQFFKSQHGQAEPMASRRETPLSHSYCKHVVATGKPLIVADAREHPLLHDNPAITENNVIAYLGIPLTTAEGQTIGSFCAIDGEPRQWTEPDVEVMENIASSVMTEIELRIMVRNFQQQCLRMRNLELEREEMVQMLVHDLRNPLSALLLGLSAMKEYEMPDVFRRLLNSAESGGTTLARMVNDILDVSKAEAGHMDLNLSEVDPGELVRSACEPIRELLTQGCISLVVAVDPSVGVIAADHEKLRRTLVNLISNATQHTPDHGKIRVTVRREAAAHRVVIEITDNGTGIPKEAFARIFEKFHRSVMPGGSKTSTGLGLPFCKKAVEAHGGSITVESELGKGTTFRVELPAFPSEPALTEAA